MNTPTGHSARQTATPPAPTRAVLIACHAGPGIGLGHVTRALGIAHALRNDGHSDVRLLVQGPPFDHAPLQDWSHRFVHSVQALSEALAADGAHLLLLDLMPGREPADLPDLLAARRRQGLRTIAIDGLLAHRALLDLVFIPNFRFTPPAELPDGAPIMFGWDCLLLGSPPKVKPWQADLTRPRRVLALTGGSDATGLGAAWPDMLDARLPVDSVLDWVTGPFAPTPRWPAAPRIAIYKHRAPSDLRPLMADARYAVTVFGVSFFELLAHGVPTVVFSPYGGKDATTLAALAGAGVACVARDEDEATSLLLALMQDDALAARLSQAALTCMAFPGGQRLARALRTLAG
jgi:spore coat polysaccharide biosynthesis predicted glycosyltransferase SpsG